MVVTDSRPASARTGGTAGRRCGRLLVCGGPAVLLVGMAIGAAGCSTGSGAASEATPTAYVVTGANVANPLDTVAVADLASARAQQPLTVGTLPAAVAVTPDGQHALIAVKGEDELVEVDVASGKVTGSATVGLEPDAVAVTPDGSLALVANLQDDTVTPVDLPSLRTGHPVPVGREPTSVAVSPDGRLAVVTNFGDGTVTPITLPSLAGEPPIPAGQEPIAALVADRGSPGASEGTVLVADFETDSLTPIPLNTRVPGPPVALGVNPTGIAGWPGAPDVYVSGGDAVVPVELAGLRAGAPVELTSAAEGLALSAGGRSAWVCAASGDLVHVDLTTGKVVGSVSVGGQPSAVAIAHPGD